MSSTLTTEVRYVDAGKPHEAFEVFTPREKEHEYSVTDGGDTFYIVTNKNAKNYKLMTAKIGHTAMKDWEELIPHRPDAYLQDITVFKNHLVLEERKNGLTQIQITDRHGKNSYYIPFADGSFMASVGDNREFDAEWLRF